MKFSADVVFRPWIGKNYMDRKPRILLLGESIYHNDGSDDSTRVINFIEGLVERAWLPKFFAAIQEPAYPVDATTPHM